MIEIENLEKYYGEQEVLHIPSLCIQSGEIIGLVGNNGAGKTTLLQLMTDLIPATKGEIRSNSVNVAQNAQWKYYTGTYINKNFLVEFFTPEEFFYFVGNAYHMGKNEVDERLALFDTFMSGDILKHKKYIRDFSEGNKQKIGIISAMMIFPKVLLLDEPFNFLDPSSQVEIKRLLMKLHEEMGSTIIVSSHNIDHITDISSRVILLEQGYIIDDIKNQDGAAKAILQRYFDSRKSGLFY